MQRYAIIEKQIGETPLAALERFRIEKTIKTDVPLAYAGRLDPMASGKLLILIGDECKQQKKYHALDKAYTFEVLFGVQSDTADVLGLIETCAVFEITQKQINAAARELTGIITLPYPHFSSKTVKGKPLHVWTLEGRLGEIEIPSRQSEVFRLQCADVRQATRKELYEHIRTKIETIPKVTEKSKALGNDFRRDPIRRKWKGFYHQGAGNDLFYIATCTCIASSGTYMRSLAEQLGKKLNTCALAYSISRTDMGTYKKLPFGLGFWLKKF